MIVLDASATIDLLIGNGEAADWVSEHLERHREVAAPHLVDVEVVNGLRRLRAATVISESTAVTALEELPNLGIERYPHVDLLPRIWELRHVLSAYDASYVALTEVLEATLVTTDGGIPGAPGLRVPIEYFER